jgi:hypothetical protein
MASIHFLLGAIVMASFVAGLFFVRFYIESRDKLFLFFAAAFWLEAMNRTLLGFSANPKEGDPIFYIVRAIAYGLILVGILHKNRRNS